MGPKGVGRGKCAKLGIRRRGEPFRVPGLNFTRTTDWGSENKILTPLTPGLFVP